MALMRGARDVGTLVSKGDGYRGQVHSEGSTACRDRAQRQSNHQLSCLSGTRLMPPLRDRSVDMSIHAPGRAASLGEAGATLPTAHADTPAATVLTEAIPAVRYEPLYCLALGAFAVGTEGFMIAAILPKIAEDLAVSLQMARQLVTIFTLVYAISSPILTALTGSVHRRKLLIATMGLFTLGNLVAASAPAYWSLA